MEIPGLAKKLVEYLDSENMHRTNHTVKNINEINMGWETELFTFESIFNEDDAQGHEDLVLRIFSGDNAATKSSKEFYLMKRLDEVGYPVPPVYYLETSGDVIGKPFIIMKRIIGKTLDASFQNETEEELRDGISKLISLFADLHKLDISVFMDVPYLSAFQSIQEIIDYYEKIKAQAPWMSPLLDWIKANKPSESQEYLSLCHMDYHGMNVMIDEQNQPYVIDWGASMICDSRMDLAWTLLLYNTFGGSMFRAPLIETYENLGGKTGSLEFFEVTAATRRIDDFVKVAAGSASAGLKPDVLDLMKQQKDHFLNVHDFLEKRTGFRLSKFDELLASF